MSEHDQLIPEFIAEAEETTASLHRDLDQLSEPQTPEQRNELMDAIFRAIHTLKGSAGMFDFKATVERAHALESKINDLRSQQRDLTPEEVEHIRSESAIILELIRNRDKTEPQTTTSAAPSPGAAPAPVMDSEGYVRVPVSTVANVNKLISEVFLVRNQVLFLVERLKEKDIEQREFFHEWDSLDAIMRRTLRDLNRMASSMQMTTAKNLYERMRTVVENYVNKTGKKINLETSGETTELDKKVVDVLGEPLIHIVRNAIDHGIEPAEERLNANKPETGTVRIEAKTDSNQILLTVTDDGRGIDVQRILAKAAEKGIDTSQIKTNREILNLIMLPGFSTAEKITEISGRGVGMDAVKASVQKLGGQIEIESEPGQGSRFSIQLPMAVSVSPVLIYEVNGQVYATPSSEVRSAITYPRKEIRQTPQGSYVRDGESFVPCLDLQSRFHVITELEFRRWSHLIYLNSGGVVQVTELLENAELVIKPLPAVFPQVPFITGLSLLPTGQPVFVVSLRRAYEHWIPSQEKVGQKEMAA